MCEQPNYAARLDDVDVKPYVGGGYADVHIHPQTHAHHAHTASPPLVYAYEDGYSSGSAPTSPLDIHGWSYPHTTGGIQDMTMLSAASCDPIFEPFINL